MKRRKVVGLILLIVTLVYLLASLLAFYQNQRVKMEKGMEEALKAYSNKEESNIKELSKDFNLMLDEKLDVAKGDEMILKFEGSFDRMENSVNSVADEIAEVGYNVTDLNERLSLAENRVEVMFNEIAHLEEAINGNLFEGNNKIVDLENGVIELRKSTLELQKSMNENKQEQENNVKMLSENILSLENIINSNKEMHASDIKQLNEIISELETVINKNEVKEGEDFAFLEQKLEEAKARISYLESNVLYYQYDEESSTLNVYGKQEENQE